MALILADVGKKRLSDGGFYASNKDRFLAILCANYLGDWRSLQRTVQQRVREKREKDE